MSANIEADDAITTKASNWVFDEHVAPHFDEHVRKSVPEYDRVQDLAVKFSDWFTYPESTVLDFGAATGETMRRIREKHSKPLNLIGYDNSQAMIEQAALKGVDLPAQNEGERQYPAILLATAKGRSDQPAVLLRPLLVEPQYQRHTCPVATQPRPLTRCDVGSSRRH